MAAMTSEDAILSLINEYFPNAHGDILLARGDDCAILLPGLELCVSTDLFVENIHFRHSYFGAGDVGHKALAVNISDLAAMGARPVAFQLALGLPHDTGEAWLRDFFKGMAALAARHEICLSGGDISIAPAVTVAITVFGQRTEGFTLLRRGGSMPGDKIFVIGSLGLARVGLYHLEKSGRAALEEWPKACAAHLRPTPMTDAGLMLARAGEIARPPALMDISDGICKDLPRLLGRGGENFGARLTLPPTIFEEEFLRHCEKLGLDPCLEACLGGEDYALLGSCAQDMLAPLRAALPSLVCIGEVTREPGIFCRDHDITNLHGFDHFNGQRA